MNNNIIKKIEIGGGVSVKVTPKEARALLDALSELLNVEPKVKIVEVDRWIPHQPYWYYSHTTIGSGTNPLKSDEWTINYCAKESTANLSIAQAVT